MIFQSYSVENLFMFHFTAIKLDFHIQEIIFKCNRKTSGIPGVHILGVFKIF